MSSLRDPAHRVSRKARTLWRIECGGTAGFALLVSAGAAAAWDTYAARWWLVATIAIMAVAYVVAVPAWRYRVHRWEVTETAVYTQRGWWARERRIAPMSRVQTVDLAQGALARLLGLATVTLTTASAAGALRIDGLDYSVAARLADELTRQADLADGDAT